VENPKCPAGEPLTLSALPEVKALLVDLDGVLYVENEPVPGARDAVTRLQRSPLILRFVTNTTSRSRPATLKKLRRLGFEVADDELVTPAALAVQHCLQAGRHRASLVMDRDVKEDFAELQEDDERPEAVIVGDLGDAFDYQVLNRAFRHVLGGAELVALQKNRYWRREDGLSLDVGPFVAALEYATGHAAHVVGKPAPAFFRDVLRAAGASASAGAMVGDDVETDVAGAMDAGLAGILVRTGKYREEAVCAAGIEPTATVDSIADVPDLLVPRPR
jgi:HAD superfamily hydrolase (TIGR01458 family)